jgi:hypothetical protein
MSPTGLRRFTRSTAECCEICAVPIDDRHAHVVTVDTRSLRCACRACSLLFARTGAGRFQTVPERYLADPGNRLAEADWDRLEVPVTPAFFFANSELDRMVACYPSPAGATECLLDLDAWQRLRQRYPLLAAPVPDVEAVYVARTGESLEAFVVPIDACYRLTGALRQRWHGLDGGDAVRRTLVEFVDDLRRRSRPGRVGEV